MVAVGVFLSPAYGFVESASGEAAPLGLVRGHLDAVAVAGPLALEEIGRDPRLLDEVLGGAAADVDDAGLVGRESEVGRLQDVADDVEGDTLAGAQTPLGYGEAVDAVAEGRAVDGHAVLGGGGEDPLLLGHRGQRPAQEVKVLAGGVGVVLVQGQ